MWGYLKTLSLKRLFKNPSILNQDNDFKWSATPDGNFSIISAYLSLTDMNLDYNNSKFKIIWKCQGNERTRFFLWKIGNEALLTNVERHRRTMAASKECPRCGLSDEILLHRFRDCPPSLAIWKHFKVRNQRNFFRNHDWGNWLRTKLIAKQINNDEQFWSTLFGVTLDLLWRNRNEFVFHRKIHNPHVSVMRIKNQVDWILSFMISKSPLLPQMFDGSDISKGVWSTPPQGYFKLNCDGSVRNHGRSAGCGGIHRADHGSFVFAFFHRLQECSTLEAELQGIFHGFNIAWGKGFRKIVV